MRTTYRQNPDTDKICATYKQNINNTQTTYGHDTVKFNVQTQNRQHTDNIHTKYKQHTDNIHTKYEQRTDNIHKIRTKNGQRADTYGEHKDNVRTMYNQHMDN